MIQRQHIHVVVFHLPDPDRLSGSEDWLCFSHWKVLWYFRSLLKNSYIKGKTFTDSFCHATNRKRLLSVPTETLCWMQTETAHGKIQRCESHCCTAVVAALVHCNFPPQSFPSKWMNVDGLHEWWTLLCQRTASPEELEKAKALY